MTIPKRKPTWPSSAHTAAELARKARRLDWRNIGAERVLDALRRGATLQLSYAPRRHWSLGSGAFVTDEVARTVIGSPNVAAVGDTLFAGELSQTWRYVTDGEDND
jgi:hypothetical protein